MLHNLNRGARPRNQLVDLESAQKAKPPSRGDPLSTLQCGAADVGPDPMMPLSSPGHQRPGWLGGVNRLTCQHKRFAECSPS